MFKKSIDTIEQNWEEKPLQTILFFGAFFRLLAVIFSKGFGMLDDHFLVIEQAQIWVNGVEGNNWLVNAKKEATIPDGHSLFYVGLHYFLFKFLEFSGLTNAQGKMYIVRFLHAAYSLITVYFGYKIVEKTSGKKVAKTAGLLLSVFWIFPWLSVRNLVEVACIPPLVMATWLAVKDEKTSVARYLLIGLLLGLSFNIRFQAILFAFGFGLALMIEKKWIGAFATALGFILCAAIVQGGEDYIVWHKPFVEFNEYVRYNIENANSYYTKPWYDYFILLFGLLIPPISVFLVFGFFRNARKKILLFLPSFVFLAFHSYFPNKQERFILPVVPFILMLGSIGWAEFVEYSKFWQRNKKLVRGFWIFFWVLNTMALCVVSVSYSKKNRVESMRYLHREGDVKGLIIEESYRDRVNMSPMFYLEKWVPQTGFTHGQSLDRLVSIMKATPENEIPNYILFYSEENLDSRLNAMKEVMDLEYKATIPPSFIDDLMYRLNPNNVNCTTYIYKITRIK